VLVLKPGARLNEPHGLRITFTVPAARTVPAGLAS
jgi:hypothetical protein